MIITLGELDLAPLPDRFSVRCGHRVAEFPVPGWTVFQDLGKQPKEFSISGLFIGPDALDKALKLSSMKDDGVPPELVIDTGHAVVSWIVRIRNVSHEIVRRGHVRYQIDAVEEQIFRKSFAPIAPEVLARQLAEVQSLSAQLPGSVLRVVQSALFGFGLRMASVLSILGNIRDITELPMDLLSTVLWNLDFMAAQLEIALSNTEAILLSPQRTFSASETAARKLACMMRELQGRVGEMKAGVLGVPRIKTEHIVSQGETLQSISALYYGSFSQWPLIAQANDLDDPTAIRPGQRLIIPQGEWGGGYACG